ncbi:hypothetical protein PU629_07405 [Pullulanibacillus sp. KACC 23026]|uniref:hypothetical protein n=1 Tax=Pullulanibacillus sp. KACC 23026 TaxID=3028315 RepID=UPI0023AEDD9B|nr:hypothetical protein [Pullulanibacillus sp. KACC 23026]WEG14184.1 hypothetical protein PU629_07405 [Pullulanibacillus sp. KACC 23026]
MEDQVQFIMDKIYNRYIDDKKVSQDICLLCAIIQIQQKTIEDTMNLILSLEDEND